MNGGAAGLFDVATAETRGRSSRIVVVSAGLALLLAGFGLLGWVTPWTRLASLVPGAIPIAPSTVLVLALLGVGVVLAAFGRAPRLTIALALAGSAIAVAQLVLFLVGLEPVLDRLFVQAPVPFGPVLTGRMSPLTALGLVGSGAGFLLVQLSARRRSGSRRADGVGVVLALLACLLGVVVVLGYGFQAPLLYGSRVVPMALPTGLALFFLGLAIVALAPGDTRPLRPFRGPSPRARLLRAFLPAVPATVAVEVLLDRIVGLSPGLHAAVTALSVAAVLAVFVFSVAHGTGKALEQAEAEREESRRTARQLAAIVESSEYAIYARSLDGTVLAWNPGAERLFGYRAAEVLGRSVAGLMAASEEQQVQTLLTLMQADERIPSRRAICSRKDGSTIAVSLSFSPLRDDLGTVAGISVIAHDISERLRGEEALRQSEAGLRELAEAIPQIVWATTATGSPLFANRRWEAYTGLSFEECLGSGWVWPFHPDDLPRAQQIWRDALAAATTYSLECRLMRHDGVYRWWLARGSPVLDSAGVVVKWYGTFTDIDDLILAERRIAESEERFSKFFHSGLMALSIAGRDSGRFVDVNERWAELFGYGREEVVGRSVFELGLWVSATERAGFIAEISAGGPQAHKDAAFRRKSGEVFHALTAIEPMSLRGNDEPLIMTALVDVTQRKLLESQLVQAQKLEAVGLLAGGIAHDFNNTLAVILGNAELLATEVAAAQAEEVAEILQAATHAADLTRQLLAFSRKQIIDPRTLDINLLLANLEKMLSRLLGEDIELAIRPAAAVGLIKVDGGQLEQVVVNLCVNARHAMPDGGQLRIETNNLEVGVDEAHDADAGDPEPITAGRWVTLVVRDSGCGIPAEVIPRIFEPFFTTKGVGEGSGLGLSMVYGTVQQAGGHIRVDSEVGLGTAVTLYFPRTDEPASATVAAATATGKGSETVLLVEDEAPVRMLLRTILSRAGYRVLEAAGGAAAIELASQTPDEIHVVLTDVVMPGMNGRAMAELLQGARPNLKVIFMSGYTNDIVAKSGVVEGGTFFLQKPFSRGDLLERVREALGGGDRGIEV